jgi:O-antigen ligase/Flp pilus assembly protein TadD
MRKNRKKAPDIRYEDGYSVDSLVFYVAIALLVLIPIAFSSLVYFKYSLPKFVVLLVGSSFLVLFLTIKASRSASRAGERSSLFRSPLVWTVCLYFFVVAASTAFGVSPLASLFGSHFNYMGLLTRVCFLVVLIALIVGIGASEKRLKATFWAMTGTGGLVATYAVAQSFGVEPFVPRSLYTFASPDGPVVRVEATLGHSDYLGHFLLYTTPLGAGLAIGAHGLSRLIAGLSAVLSIVAIVFSGTRGAWLGIIIGMAVFVALELKRGVLGLKLSKHRVLFTAALVSTLLLISIVILSPAFRSVTHRARALITEGTSSSGRALLWRDSLRMLPSMPLVGSGPEGFRKAFLAFKSRELSRLNPRANNESSHNAYLDAAVSYGLAGAALYGAIIVSTFVLFIRARRRPQPRELRIVMSGLVASFVAVMVHNVFIFDQISTGLYFFAYVAVAQAITNVTSGSERAGSIPKAQSSSRSGRHIALKADAPRRLSSAGKTAVAGSCLLVAASIWYSAGLVRSDVAHRELLDSTASIDADQVTMSGGRITSSPLPTGAYDFLFARAVDTLVKQLAVGSNATPRLRLSGGDPNATRARLLALGILHGEKSLADTLTPELNYSVLASLALAAGDVDRLRHAASEAVRYDPNNYHARWLLAESHLVQGEREEAAREAEIALALYPRSPEAASTLARARGTGIVDDSSIAEIMARSRDLGHPPKRSLEDVLELSRALVRVGKLQKARTKLLVAIGRASSPCPDCHRELAIIYEKLGRFTNAVAEWETCIEQSPESSAEEIKAHLTALKRTNGLPE